MADNFPQGVNPCLLDYTEYLCDKAGLHEQTFYGLLEQYIHERGAEQPGIFLVKFTPTKIVFLRID